MNNYIVKFTLFTECPSRIMVRVFANGPPNRGSNPGLCHTKDLENGN